MPGVSSRAESQSKRDKLVNSYHELLEEFSSKELRSVGNYALGRLIGKGSFGKVYLASHKLTNGSKVVLKSAKKTDPNLAREIHHHRQFLHPHIARLFEVIVTESLVWLVLEYCPGDELYNYLLENGPLPTDKVQKIFSQLVGAVAYVHNMSCVHRDLKLENILLDKEGNVKLCDFGFTREYEGKASYLQTFCGTVCYSAPEMLKGEKYAGEKVDVWSLGVILYALLTGELPFDDDDDNATKAKILRSEPKYPENLPGDAKSLIQALLSKRPLIRPSLSEILSHPYLAEQSPQQQAILKLTRPAPFTSKLEKDTLDRMRSAGVNTDQVMESVIAQKCDSFAGWWALLVEKEERKEIRRERKRKEKEAELRHMRRLSSASSRLEKLAPNLKDVHEEVESPRLVGDPPRSRGRKEQRNSQTPQFILTDLPRLPGLFLLESPVSATPPPPIEKDSVQSARSTSSSRQRPPLPPKENARKSRNSTLQLVSSNPDLLSPNSLGKRRHPRRHQYAILNHLASLKHWLMESTKRARSPLPRSQAPPSASQPDRPEPGPTWEPPPKSLSGIAAPSLYDTSSPPPRTPRALSSHYKRTSLSPSPITSHGYRRTSAGLRGRKSTSSSVSSIRSIHHHQHTHSKASSTSSNSITSTSMAKTSRSPRNSIKVLPATPTTSSFPSNIRVVRAGYSENPNIGPQSPGLIYAKRKRSPFKGPMLSVGQNSLGIASRRETSLSRSASAAGRRSGEIIEEEDEDEVEEVDAFSPVSGSGEVEFPLEESSGLGP